MENVLDGNLHVSNNQIRDFCAANNKVLFDFADIESYDLDGNYFGDKLVDEACSYDSNNDSIRDANWATEWQDANPGEWYDCTSAHSQPVNANQKAYAAWWLWATLAGWDDPNFPYTPTTLTPYSTPDCTNPLPIYGTIIGLGAAFTIALSVAILINKNKK